MLSKLKEKVSTVAGQIAGLDVPRYAAHTSFFIVLSLFPALVLALGILRHTGLGVELLMEILEGFLPKALQEPAANLVMKAYRSTTGTVLSVSALTALWSASRGIHGLLLGLNNVYRVEETRGWLRTRLTAVFYTFAFLLVMILTLVLHLFGNSMIQWLALQDSFLFRFLEELIGWRFLLLLVVQAAVFTCVYMFLPNGHTRLVDALPGALFATIGWQVFTHLYSMYGLVFNQLSVVYGSVYAVALGMLWLYICVSIVFYGGVMNRYLSRKS